MFSRREVLTPQYSLNYINYAIKEHKEDSSFNAKDVVLMLGDSGSGKSTFVNYMAGCDMEYKTQNLDTVVLPQVGSKELTKIGTFTEFPFAVPSGKDFLYMDCGGANKSFPMLNISSTLRTFAAIRQSSSLRGIVITIDYSIALADKAGDFYNVMKNLESSIEDFTEQGKSILFVLTNVKPKLQLHHVLRKIQELSGLDSSDRRYGIAQRWLKMLSENPNNLVLFHPTDSSQRIELLEKINSLKPLSKTKLMYPPTQPYADFKDSLEFIAKQFIGLINQRERLIQSSNKEEVQALNEIQKEITVMEEQGLKKIYDLVNGVPFKSELIDSFLAIYSDEHKKEIDLNKTAQFSLS